MSLIGIHHSRFSLKQDIVRMTERLLGDTEGRRMLSWIGKLMALAIHWMALDVEQYSLRCGLYPITFVFADKSQKVAKETFYLAPF
jgi:hypothetical protein